ncbi:MAG: SIR2 family protein [Pseudomonadales bacterium]|nr:SIR2 family protein [Pseudomonadales bacterium]
MKARDLHNALPRNKLKEVSDLAVFLKTKAQGQPNYTVLLGAGASVTSGVRSANQLIEEWRESIYRSLCKNGEAYTPEKAKLWLKSNASWYDENKEYSCLFEHKYHLAAQRRVFVETEVSSVYPSIGYMYLSTLVNKDHLNTIFTTNFDDLINESLFRFSDVRPITCAHDSAISAIRISSARPKIIKLHGDFLYDNIQCTAEETSKLQANMAKKLKQFLKEFGLIVSGYSGRDDSIMNELTSLIEGKDDEYLNYGVYWALRPDDDVSDNLFKFLSNQKVYYVIIDGFDELFAELYKETCGTVFPFLGSNFNALSNDISERWLNSSLAKDTKSEIIKSHLTEIKRGNKSSALANAYANLVPDDEDGGNQESSFNNDEMLVLLNISRFLNDGNYEDIIKITEKECTDARPLFKRQLLNKSYTAYKRMNDMKGARRICEELIEIDEKPSNYLKKADVTSDIDEKLGFYELAIELDPYQSAAYREKASTLINLLDLGIKPSSVEITNEIDLLLRKSIEVNPSYENSAWFMLFKYVSSYIQDKSERNEKLIEIIDTLRKQDKFSPLVSDLIFMYCERNKDSNFQGKSLFEELKDCVNNNFPKKHPRFLSIILDAGIEFENHEFVYEYQDYFDGYPWEYNRSEFHMAKSRLYLEIYRDLDLAISYLDEHSFSLRSQASVEYMIELNLLNGSTEKAQEMLDRQKSVLSFSAIKALQAEIYLEKGEFEESLSCYMELSQEEFFEETNALRMSYVCLRMKDYQRAKDIASKTLKKHNFSKDSSLDALIINYEYAVKMLKNMDHHKNTRLSDLAQESKDKDVQAMAFLIMGEDDKAIELLVSQSKKKYSKLLHYKLWPITQPVIARLANLLNPGDTKLSAVS